MAHHNTTLSGIGGYLAEACPTVGPRPVGDGSTAEEAIADLRDALTVLIEEVGVPQELTLEVA